MTEPGGARGPLAYRLSRPINRLGILKMDFRTNTRAREAGQVSY
jgi:hypothetical protein